MKVGDTWTGVVTAGGASATGAEITGVRLYLRPNCHCSLAEVARGFLSGTAGNFPLEEEGVGGSSPCRDVMKG